MRHKHEPKKIGVIGTYLPRRCGIATFTYDTVSALKSVLKDKAEVVTAAMNDVDDGYDYGPDVHLEILEKRTRDYLQAAEFFNINIFDVVLLEHEFGIFGGPSGNKILQLIDNLHVPLVVNLHTVLKDLLPQQKQVLDGLNVRADKLVVMTHKAKEILTTIHGITPEKVAVIPHGTPDFSFIDPSYHKEKFHILGKQVILTFGLLSPNKGLELMIEAMPKILDKNPNAVYLIVGSMHPHQEKINGITYLQKLKNLTEKLGVTEAVKFHEGFFSIEELMEYIESADVYVTPYLHREQITSGTLAYAMSAGKPIVSTPYWHAEEFLAEGRGVLTEFNSSESLARDINHLLGDEVTRSTIRKKAYEYCRGMTWEAVGKKYVNLFSQILYERVTDPRPAQSFPTTNENLRIPKVDLKYVKAMTDDTGMLEHAKYAIPNSKHGYCTDDNARALVATLLHYQLDKDEEILPYIYRYMSFLLHAFDPKSKWMRNRLFYNRVWCEKDLSESAHSRALWALGLGCAVGPREIQHGCKKLFHDALPSIIHSHHPHTIAYTLQGIHYYLQNCQIDSISKDYRNQMAQNLYDLFEKNITDDWIWFENKVSWGAGIIPSGLIIAGRALPNKPYLEMGLHVLRWLIDQQTDENGHLSFIGNAGWYRRGEKRPIFDQQPIDGMNLVWACIDAYQATRDNYWQEKASLALRWFLGANPLHIPLYDPLTGGCRDGLQASGANENQGAESTLAWVIAALRYQLFERSEKAKKEVDEAIDEPIEWQKEKHDERIHCQTTRK